MKDESNIFLACDFLMSYLKLNNFHDIVLFLYLLKISENLPII